MKQFICFLLIFGAAAIAVEIDMEKEDCELFAPNTMHEFCCEIHDENNEFMECAIEWTEKIAHTNEEQEMSYNFCVSECVFNKTNYLKPDRKSLRMNVIKMHLNDLHGDEASETLMYQTYEKCAKHAEHMLHNEAVQKLEKRLAEHNCHPYPGLVFECVSNELILNCPPNKFHGTASCDQARDYLKVCLKHKQQT